MKRAALSVALLAATSSAASAGTYVGIGIGTNEVTESMDRLLDDGRSARLIVGYQFRPMKYGTLAIEGLLDGYGIALSDTTPRPMDAYQISIAGRFDYPFDEKFGAYGRLGLQHTTIGGYAPLYDSSGNGFLVGAGIAYRFDVGIGSGASVWLDYQLNKSELSGERFKDKGALQLMKRQWTLGVAIGF